jgi:hypothetical protein
MTRLEESNDPTPAQRGAFLSTIAVLFVILALSDFTKVLQHHSNPADLGLVILGHRFTRFLANLTLGPLFGAFLLTYAYGLWNLQRWVIPISVFYAFYVPVNEVLFWSRHIHEPPKLGFILVYLTLSLGGSIGTALYLAYHRAKLQ